jgi:hypothetical protein
MVDEHRAGDATVVDVFQDGTSVLCDKVAYRFHDDQLSFLLSVSTTASAASTRAEFGTVLNVEISVRRRFPCALG